MTTDIICINSASSSTTEKMEWKGSIKIPEKREFYVKGKFVMDESNGGGGDYKQTNLMNKLQNDFFNKLKKIEIQSNDVKDIFQRLEVTRYYRDLIYVRFEPDNNKNKSWVIIGNKMKTYVNDEAVYEEEFNEYKEKKKTYSVVHLRSEFNNLIENFFIFGLKSKQTDKMDLGLKDNLDLPLIRNRDLLIGVIITVFEKEKQKIPKMIVEEKSAKENNENKLKNKKDESIVDDSISKDPRLKRYSSLIINNRNDSIDELNNDNAEIKKEKLQIKRENVYLNGVHELTYTNNTNNNKEEDKYSTVSGISDEEENQSTSITNQIKMNKLFKKETNDGAGGGGGGDIIWKGYFITDINSKIESNLTKLNENDNFNQHLKPFLKEETKIYIDKLSSCSETNHNIFDYLTSLDRKLIQFLKFESNDKDYFKYIDELTNRNKRTKQKRWQTNDIY